MKLSALRRKNGSSRSFLRGWLLLVALPGARVLVAQVANDVVPRERTIPTQQQLDSDIETSRYHLGPFFVLPLVSIRNLGYDSNVFDSPKRQEAVSAPVSDWTADVSAGVRTVVRLGNRMYLRGEALPQYTWYLKLRDRRQFGGLYRGSWFGLFSRVSFEVDGVSSQSTSILSTESLARVREDLRSASARMEFEITRPVSIFGNATTLRLRYFTDSHTPAEIQSASQLNRIEEAGRAGLRFRLRHNMDVTAVVEETRTRFESAAQRGDNRTTAYLAGLHYDFHTLFLNLSGGYRQGRGEAGSEFPSYGTGTGSYFVSFFPARRVELQAYGQRSTSYGLTVENPYYFSTSNGGGINVGAGRNVTLRAYGEYGINRYPVPVILSSAVTINRKDQTTTYGGGFSFTFLRHAVLTALASSTEQVSNIPGLSRSIFRFSTSVNFQGDFRK